jgi:hypothetical protein
MKTGDTLGRAGLAILALAWLAAAGGCEDGGVGDAEFRIEPASVTLTASQTTVVLQAVGGIMPLTWSVTDETRGTVSGSGQTATYTRKDVNGVNQVEVTDGRTWVAAALIVQTDDPAEEPPPETLAVTPSDVTLANDGDTVLLEVTGGYPPYTWTLQRAARGRIVTQANEGASIVYARETAGENILTVTDRSGRSVILIVAQP